MIYTECSMSTQGQYGQTLFLDGFQEGSSAKKLEQVRFSKKASVQALAQLGSQVGSRSPDH
jgi:hypothetical protein